MVAETHGTNLGHEQPIKELFVSGYLEEDAMEQGHDTVVGAKLTWLAPEKFAEGYKAVESLTDQHWIWLYRSPWSLAIASSCIPADKPFLREWLKWQRIVLDLSHEKPAPLFLINRETTSIQELLSTLGLPHIAIEQPSSQLQRDMSTALGKLFEWVAPYFWEVFEALEAMAWISKDIPKFRDALVSPMFTTLDQITSLFIAGQHLPIVKNELSELKHEQKETFEIIKKNLNITTSLEKENQSLAEKLTQKDRELEALRQKITALSTSEKKQSEELKFVQNAHAALLEENELLLLQLHKTQEELEHYMLANQHFQTILAHSQQSMDRARVLMSQLAMQ